jgi:hypothetical protein
VRHAVRLIIAPLAWQERAMSWYDSDFELTQELQRRGWDVDEEDVAAARLDAGKDFNSGPLGEDDLKDIIRCLGAKKGELRPVASPEQTAEFKRKLASPEWHQLVEVGRKHLGIPVGPDVAAPDSTIGAVILGLGEMINQAHQVASGSERTFEYSGWPLFWAWWVELHRVAASLASYLGTRSIGEIAGDLLRMYPLQPETLVPASQRTAVDDFTAGVLGLAGIRWSGSFWSQRLKDGLLCGLVGTARGYRFRSDWEEARIIWNRNYPAWAYQSTEAFRKAYERGQKRRSSSDGS